MCSVCVAPPLGRHSSLYNLDMDWIREGRVTSLSQEQDEAHEGVKTIETELKSLSDLMTDLVNLSSVLHSLQVKLSVARQRNNPKVFMWSSDWDDTALGLETGETDLLPPVMEAGGTFETDTEGNDATFETVSSGAGEGRAQGEAMVGSARVARAPAQDAHQAVANNRQLPLGPRAPRALEQPRAEPGQLGRGLGGRSGMPLGGALAARQPPSAPPGALPRCGPLACRLSPHDSAQAMALLPTPAARVVRIPSRPCPTTAAAHPHARRPDGRSRHGAPARG